MARVTVEDCVERIPNRFELVLLAAQRARNLSRGEELTVERDNDKNPVVALREIADETIDLNKLEQDLVKSLSRSPELDKGSSQIFLLSKCSSTVRARALFVPVVRALVKRKAGGNIPTHIADVGEISKDLGLFAKHRWILPIDLQSLPDHAR